MIKRTLIIAEAGVNHNGDLTVAKRLVDAAAEAGADYVKFQTFKAEKLVSKEAKQAAYQQENTQSADNSQFEMLKKLELSKQDHLELITYCEEHNIRFLSTGFDLESLDLLYELGIRLFKVPSGEITNYPYLKKVASLADDIIISTGMANMIEIQQAIKVFIEEGVSLDKIAVLHCNTEYPTPMGDVNLNAMKTIAEECKTRIGYSDHTLGIEVPIAAVALGAQIIEKHFTLDRSMKGPDHLASLEPDELKNMVQAIRNIELATMGNGIKEPSLSESKNMIAARKSIHLAKDLDVDHILEESDLIALRPGSGISPMEWNTVLGKKIKGKLKENHQLKWDDLI